MRFFCFQVYMYTLVISFFNSNEEIVYRNPKPKILLIIYSLLSCLLSACMILQFIHISHLSKSLSSILAVSSWLRRLEDCILQSALICDIVLFDMPVILLAPCLYFDNGAHSTSFMASSRTFKITCAEKGP